ncbi:MAG: AMP-binding protein [Bacteroidales bacterium]|nr:AMP-binding protein [Candidatus Cryptobacteroides onthequi]
MIHYLAQLENTVKTYWNDKALCNYKGEEFTFGDLATNIEKFHIFFEKIGVKKGQKIAICASNSARWATTFLAINTYEAVVVPLLSEFLPENAGTLTTHSEAVLLFVDKSTWEKMTPEMVPNVRCVIDNANYNILFCREDEIVEAYNSLNEALAAKYPMGFTRENVKFPVDNEKDLAVINYTSGTTSAPKGVMLRYESLSASIDFAIRHIPADNTNNIVSMLPMGHIYGMVFEFLYPLSCGVTVYYLGKAPAASTLLKAVGEVKPYIVITVPLVMEKIYKTSIKPVLSKPAMKVLTSIPGINKILYGVIRKKLMATFGGNVCQFIMGGAALNPEVEKVFRKLGLPYTVGYGMTEAAPLLAYAEPWIYVQGSCGMKLDSCDVRIDSEDPEHIAGEIQAKGRNICSGYFNNPEASAGAFTADGYLHTGDLGTMDKNGNITIRGRSKNMILSANGQNIYPEEVEAVINAQDYVTESVVVDRATKLVALVYLDEAAIKKAGLDDETVSDIPENIRKASNKLLPSYSQITKVELVLEPFEKTPKMSIKRFMYK